MGLLARALELAGIASVVTSWLGSVTRLTKPPRASFSRLQRGATLGNPGDAAQQIRVLRATLALLEQDAPLEPITLDEQ